MIARAGFSGVLRLKFMVLTVLRPSSSFRNGPGDILSGHLDIAQLAVDAILKKSARIGKIEPVVTYLRIDDQLLSIPAPRLSLLRIDILVDTSRACTSK